MAWTPLAKRPGLRRAVGDVIRVVVLYSVDLPDGSEIEVRVTEVDEDVLRAQRLHDPPPGLEGLRGVLLREHTWRRREGLA